MEAGKWRLAGDTAIAATTNELKDLRREARIMLEVGPAIQADEERERIRRLQIFCHFAENGVLVPELSE